MCLRAFTDSKHYNYKSNDFKSSSQLIKSKSRHLSILQNSIHL